ncbi:MAG TPA: MlaE family lipid ABC transporter permease subunit [Azospirillaceae bacterium]|nr:MlaE family lipid ABC transporter permease subunit [Azospirillaceae bacterium]
MSSHGNQAVQRVQMATATTAGRLDWRDADGRWVLAVQGRWDLAHAEALRAAVEAVVPPPPPPPPGAAAAKGELDLSGLEAADTAGAVLLKRLADRLAAQGWPADFTGVRPAHAAILEAVWTVGEAALPSGRPLNPIAAMTLRTGEAAVAALEEARDLLSFFGLLSITFARVLVRPWKLRFTALVFHMEQTGLNALPILGLLSFLIGVVLAYQGADQLRPYGAQIFVVNLLGISVLREIGILMTAIIIAGRSGSAFTAQIGTMKVNQEVDALRTIGLDPMELLVIPRVLALMITLPLLAFYANIVALAGGAVMSYFVLDISVVQFVKQLRLAVPAQHLFAGLIKAPVFALVIGMVGCYEGLKVSGSAESVGRLTTKSVVEAIFLVIIIDAVFSVMFSYLGV